VVPDFIPPPDDGTNRGVPPGCLTAPQTPPVNDYCGNPITPVLVTSPSPLDCEGDMPWVYNYTDCAGHSHDWTYTYTIDMPDFILPADDGTTVDCIAAAIEPVPPVVEDYCGNTITPSGPVTGGTYVDCEGTFTYTWTYTDCAGHSHDWTYTYTIVLPDFTVPADDGTTVDCIAAAIEPVPPVVEDYCGNTITPSGPVTGGTYVDCEGTFTYTWTYTDCAGHSTTGPIPIPSCCPTLPCRRMTVLP